MSPVDATLSVAGAVALGCAGWFATNFLARPLLRVYELREKVWEELLVTANVTMFDDGVFEDSMAKLRRFSAQASALDIVWPSYMRGVLAVARIDLAAAAQGLLGLSNTIGMSIGGDGAYREQIETALRLPQGPRAHVPHASDRPRRPDPDDHPRNLARLPSHPEEGREDGRGAAPRARRRRPPRVL
jgi:hypothetical protein